MTLTLRRNGDHVEVDWMTGGFCTRVHEHDEGSGAFMFEFTTGGMRIECAWRIIRDRRLACAHTDHGQRFGLPAFVDVGKDATSLLAGRPIIGGRIDPELGDIVLEFEGGVRLEVFNDSSGYEGWKMSGPNNQTLFAASGGEVSSY